MAITTYGGTDIVAVTKSDATDDPAGPFRALVMDAQGADSCEREDLSPGRRPTLRRTGEEGA